MSLGVHLGLSCFDVLVESRKAIRNVEMPVYIVIVHPQSSPFAGVEIR